MTGLWVKDFYEDCNQKLIIILELILYHLYNIFAYKKKIKSRQYQQ